LRSVSNLANVELEVFKELEMEVVSIAAVAVGYMLSGISLTSLGILCISFMLDTTAQISFFDAAHW
jgi:hypothetical protein